MKCGHRYYHLPDPIRIWICQFIIYNDVILAQPFYHREIMQPSFHPMSFPVTLLQGRIRWGSLGSGDPL